MLTKFVPSTFHGEARMEFRDNAFFYEIVAPASFVRDI